MSTVTSVKQRQNPRVEKRINPGYQILLYDSDNGYPQRTTRILEASPTGVACRNLFAKFVKGQGFEDQGFMNATINFRKQKVWQLLNQLSKDFANHGYFSLHLNYNLNYEIVSMTRINPEFVRLGTPDSYGFSPKVGVWPHWYEINREFPSKQDPDYINVFNPDPYAIQAQIEVAGGVGKYRGQVYTFWGDAQEYPEAIYDSVLNDLIVDSKFSEKNLGDLQNGFSAGQVFVFPEKLEDEDRNKKLAHLQQVQGTNGRRIFLIDGVGVDGLKIEQVAHNFSDTQFQFTEVSTRGRIMRAWGQIPILHGEDRGNTLSSDGKALENAYRFYNQFTQNDRAAVENAFKTLIPHFWNPINPSEDYSIKPLHFLEEETNDNNNTMDNPSGLPQ